MTMLLQISCIILCMIVQPQFCATFKASVQANQLYEVNDSDVNYSDEPMVTSTVPKPTILSRIKEVIKGCNVTIDGKYFSSCDRSFGPVPDVKESSYFHYELPLCVVSYDVIYKVCNTNNTEIKNNLQMKLKSKENYRSIDFCKQMKSKLAEPSSEETKQWVAVLKSKMEKDSNCKQACIEGILINPACEFILSANSAILDFEEKQFYADKEDKFNVNEKKFQAVKEDMINSGGSPNPTLLLKDVRTSSAIAILQGDTAMQSPEPSALSVSSPPLINEDNEFTFKSRDSITLPDVDRESQRIMEIKPSAKNKNIPPHTLKDAELHEKADIADLTNKSSNVTVSSNDQSDKPKEEYVKKSDKDLSTQNSNNSLNAPANVSTSHLSGTGKNSSFSPKEIVSSTENPASGIPLENSVKTFPTVNAIKQVSDNKSSSGVDSSKQGLNNTNVDKISPTEGITKDLPGSVDTYQNSEESDIDLNTEEDRNDKILGTSALEFDKNKETAVNEITPYYQGQFVNAEDSHFFAYFMTMVVICIIGYLVFHNKQKILALALEGRSRRGTRRRPNTSGYRKLDSNLEEAVTSTCSTSVTHVIY